MAGREDSVVLVIDDRYWAFEAIFLPCALTDPWTLTDPWIVCLMMNGCIA